MKKVLISVILASVASLSFAQWRHPHYEYRNNNWVGPLIIGGIAGAIIARESQPVYVQPQTVYMQPQQFYVEPAPIVRQTVCTEWKEIQTPDGRIYRERGCYTQ